MQQQEHLTSIAPKLSRTELSCSYSGMFCSSTADCRFQQQNILFLNQKVLLSDSSPLLFHIIYKTQALENKQINS